MAASKTDRLRSVLRTTCYVAGAMLIAVTVCHARTAGPVLRLPLENFDYLPMPASVLNAGAAAITLHYIDDKHLLLTFSRRRLLTRSPDDQPTDFGRNVDAVLVELPTGKVLARTSWRQHDTEPYLWALPDGNFLLRERNRLVTIAPLAMLSQGKDAFAQRPFASSSRRIEAVIVSPAEDLLTLETRDAVDEAARAARKAGRAAAAAVSATAGEEAAEDEPGLVQIDFFRIAATPGGELKPVHAGTINSHSLVRLPVDATGLVTSLDQGRSHWAFDFHHHDGKVDELSPFDTTCRPEPMMVSRSEFIAFGCRGGQDRRAIGGFNLRGEEMWEQSFMESFTHPELAFAPGSGRFALGRMVIGTPIEPGMPLTPGQITAESVSVYQTESGRVLLELNLNPVIVSGQNFALSPDGRELAAVNNGALEVYALPEVTAKERQAMHLAETLIPERPDAPIKLEAIRERSPEHKAPLQPATAATEAPARVPGDSRPVQTVIGRPASDAVAKAEEAAAETSARPAAPVGTQVVNGDPVEEDGVRRKAPTLYAPGEPGAPGGPSEAAPK